MDGRGGYFGEVEQRFRESGTRIPAKWNAHRSVATVFGQCPPIGVALDLRDFTRDVVFESTDGSACGSCGRRLRVWTPPKLQAFSESPLLCAPGGREFAGSVLRDSGVSMCQARWIEGEVGEPGSPAPTRVVTGFLPNTGTCCMRQRWLRPRPRATGCRQRPSLRSEVSSSRTVNRGCQAAARLLRSAPALRVTATADRAGSPCGPAGRLAHNPLPGNATPARRSVVTEHRRQLPNGTTFTSPAAAPRQRERSASTR